MTVRKVAELDFPAVTARAMTASPSAWEDEVLYFLLVDRFSDGREEDDYLGLDGQPVAGTTAPSRRPAIRATTTAMPPRISCLLLVDRVRRSRRVTRRHRQTHGPRGHPILLLCRPRIRAVHRQGPVPARRRDHRVAAGCDRHHAVDGSGCRPRVDRCQQQLNNAATGAADPTEYFSLFRNSELIGKDSHTWLRNTVVTSFDDHDQVRQGGTKSRFGARGDGRSRLAAVAAMTATTLGIPCFYYGTEQHLDGSGGGPNPDRCIREALFGGEFGPFRSRDRRLFDESSDGYRLLVGLFGLRGREPALRRGRQYLREISGDGSAFGLPTGFGGLLRGVIGWSRILADREVLCVVNTDLGVAHQVWVTIDAGLHRAGDRLQLLHATTPGPPSTVAVEPRNGMAVQVSVPPGCFAACA